jgi:hypothetical protein
LQLVWPTWVRHRPEILTWPLIIICDGELPIAEWERQLAFVAHPQRSLVPWSLPALTQREKMLNSFVFVTASHVRTTWYLKLDTDTVATRSGEWLLPEWFMPSEDGNLPAFIASPWGYTKPADSIMTLDEWGDSVADLARHPRLNIIPTAGANRVSHRRIISWCFFGNTEATKQAAGYCAKRLPVPSQDTFLWYCAARRQDFFRRVSMRQYGWAHVSRWRSLKKACALACTSPPLFSDQLESNDVAQKTSLSFP